MTASFYEKCRYARSERVLQLTALLKADPYNVNVEEVSGQRLAEIISADVLGDAWFR